jgi:hypothetical protein
MTTDDLRFYAMLFMGVFVGGWIVLTVWYRWRDRR